MLRRTTSAWTDLRIAFLTICLLTVSLGWAAALSGSPNGLVVIGVVAATIVVASFADVFGGLVVGLVGATGVAAWRHFTLPATAGDLTGGNAHLTTLGLLLALGASTGLFSDRVRRSWRMAGRIADGAVTPVAGSLGLISTENAHVRLEEEIQRARLHDRPLTTAAVHVHLPAEGLSSDQRRRVRRTVARTLETELRATDVPFVSEDGHFGIILPETDRPTAVDFIESALIAARQATWNDRATDSRRPVAESAEVHLGVAEATHTTRDPRAMIDSSRASMAPVRERPEAR